MTGELLAAAQAAAGRGWHVFPLRPDDKRPAIRDWEARATADPDRIARCWNAGPYNIGIATGPSRLVVLDLDVPKPGDTAPAAWVMPGVSRGEDVLAVLAERAGQPLPVDTYLVRTGRGGLHAYYSTPAGPELRNTAGRLGWLVDTRAAGGYVVAAGSVVKGRRYRVLAAAEPAPLPAWLRDALTEAEPAPREATVTMLLSGVRRRSRYAEAALRDELQRVLDAQTGTRNDTLCRAAFAVGQLVADDLLPHHLAAEALASAGRTIGLAERETAATVRSGLDAGARTPRGGPRE